MSRSLRRDWLILSRSSAASSMLAGAMDPQSTDHAINCYVCGTDFTSAQLFDDHIQSEAHKRNVDGVSQLPRGFSLDTATGYMDPTAVYHCGVCNINVSGIVPYKQHLEGQKHYKKVKNYKMLEALRKMEAGSLGGATVATNGASCVETWNSLKAMTSVVTRESLQKSVAEAAEKTGSSGDVAANAGTDDDEEGSVNGTAATTTTTDGSSVGADRCAEQLDSLTLSEEHDGGGTPAKTEDKASPLLVSDRMKTSPAILSLLKDIETNVASIKQSTSPALGHSALPLVPGFDSRNSFPYSCRACVKWFTGEEPYRQHLSSAQHLKKSAGLGANVGNLVCDACCMTFSGPIPYKQHLESTKHQKQVYFKKGMRSDPPTPFNGGLRPPDRAAVDGHVESRITIISVDQPFVLK